MLLGRRGIVPRDGHAGKLGFGFEPNRARFRCGDDLLQRTLRPLDLTSLAVDARLEDLRAQDAIGVSGISLRGDRLSVVVARAGMILRLQGDGGEVRERCTARHLQRRRQIERGAILGCGSHCVTSPEGDIAALLMPDDEIALHSQFRRLRQRIVEVFLSQFVVAELDTEPSEVPFRLLLQKLEVVRLRERERLLARSNRFVVALFHAEDARQCGARGDLVARVRIANGQSHRLPRQRFRFTKRG